MPVIQPRSSGAGEAPQTFKQPSRKGKKAWRKNVDVTEVQKGLADLNEEIISGGVIKEKSSAELFTIDTARDAKAAERHKQSKKTLRADEIIAARSSIPAVSLRKRPGDGKVSDGIIPAKRQRTEKWVSHKELARLKRVADGQHEKTIEITDARYDVWDTPDKAIMAEEEYDFLEAKRDAKAPKSMKQKPVSLLANGKPLPAVQKPTGGYSYNPLFEEYEGRLTEEGKKAIEAEQKRLDVIEAENQKVAASARSAAEAEAAEARAELSEWEEDSEWEGFQSGAEGDAKTSAKRPERKTQTQRNRIKRRKEEERLAKHKAAMKIRRVQEGKIKELAEEVSETEASRALAVINAMQLTDSEDEMEGREHKLRRRQIGKYKLPEKDLELVLPDELQESLRLLKPEGNLLKDRYRSMLMRGKVESRKHIPFKRQANKKVTEKWTHKDFII